MSTPYVGEIRIFAGNFAPVGWLLCQGQLLAISDYDVLFNLIGTTYGGDGDTTFALPALASRIPLHQGPGYTIGQLGGVETVTLSTNQLPVHSHVPRGSSASGTTASPSGAVWAGSTYTAYSDQSPDSAMATNAILPSGGSQAHDNMPPFLAVNFIIAVQGIYPSPT